LVTASDNTRTFVRCGNYGDLEFTDTFKSANAFRCAGFYPRQENAAPVVMEDCFNAGNITMNGTSSARSGGNFKFAGGVADIQKGTLTIKGSFKNTGNISVGGKNSTASLYVSSMGHLCETGSLLADGEGEVKIINTGKITVTGTATDDLRVGGIFSVASAGVLSENLKLINTGDIEVSGAFGASNTAYVGGIVGSATRSIANAESYCNIKAYRVADGKLIMYNGVGQIMGSHRADSNLASNCKVGGTIATDYDTEDEEDKVIALDSTNFHNYIYGSGEATDWGTSTNYDGCTLLSEKPIVE
jgi:hypothetical protein